MNGEMIALHKTFDKGDDGKRQLVIHISDGMDHRFLPPKKFAEFLAMLSPTTRIRSTAVNATDAVLLDLAERGNKIEYAHWHATGLEKGMAPADIVMQYALLPQELFRPFKPRRDIAELKRVLALRNAILQFQGDATRRLRQAGRDAGDPEMEIAQDAINSIRKGIVLEEGTPLDKHVTRLAAQIPECVLFKEISGFKDGWMMAATFVAYSGGFDRFQHVASLWHYYGQHVGEDGRMPRRKKGSNITWHPGGRTMLYQLSSTIMKNAKNPWHQFFQETKAVELAEHDRKHPGCKTKAGHCNAMALRKMAKEIVKRFFLAEKGLDYKQNHNPLDQLRSVTHNESVLAG